MLSIFDQSLAKHRKFRHQKIAKIQHLKYVMLVATIYALAVIIAGYIAVDDEVGFLRTISYCLMSTL